MFIKLKQKIKKYWTKTLSKKFSGFGIFKFPNRKVLLGVFLMVMIFGGVFGRGGEVEAAYDHTYSLGQCFNTKAECDSAAKHQNSVPLWSWDSNVLTKDPNEPLMRCTKEEDGPPYCLITGSALDIATGQDVTGTIVNPVVNAVIVAITEVLKYLANIILAVVYAICWLLLHLCGIFVDLSANFLHATLDPSLYKDMFGSESTVVAEGWKIVRDVCNMFFILILLIISLATILRIQAYKAQSLLLPLLLAAFLVNFSRPIVELAIDASQILMYQFVNLMGGSFIDSNVNQTLTGMTDLFIDSFGGWDKVGAIVMGSLMNAVSWVIAIMFALVFIIVLALVYAAMALFMIIRLVALTILIIFSPIGFFFNILPQTKSYASKYWAELSKYLIFGPVMAFFIYLAGHLAITVPAGLQTQLAGIAANNNLEGDGATILTKLLASLLPYVIIMVFLYAAIWIARQLGIWGADKVQAMTTGKAIAFAGMAGGAIGGAVGGYLGGAAGRAGTWTAGAANKVSGGRLVKYKEKLKKLPGGSGIIAAESKIKAKQRKKAEEYEATLNSQSSDVVRARGNSVTANPEESAAAVKILAARDDLDKVKDKKLFEKAKRGGIDEDEIHNRMPTWAGDKQDKQKEVKRIAEEGKVNQISSESLKDKDIMNALREQLSSDEMKRIYRVWGKKQQDAAEEGLKEGFETFSDDDIKRRGLFAKLSGKIKEAFEVSPGVTTTAGDNAAKEHVLKMTPRDIEKVDEKDDLEVVGAYITEGQLASIGGELSGDQKKVIKDLIRTTRSGSDEDNFVNTSPNWAV